MRLAVRFLLPLIAVLALLSWAASTIVSSTGRRWFAKDVSLRAELAIAGARDALARHLETGDRVSIERILDAITRDERIMASAACAANLEPVARTADFPAQFDCADLGRRVHPNPGGPWREFAGVTSVSGGNIHLSVIPLGNANSPVGFVALVHDMTYAERREALTRRFSLLAFAVLAIVGSAVTIVMAKLARRRWIDELRRFVRGGAPAPGFQPIVHDLRELVARLAAENEGASGGNHWTPERLRATLERHMHGERVIIVANREPYIHERRSDGRVEILHPASGLVTALEPVMRACSGVWVAHGSGSADREVVDTRSRVRVPPGSESYLLHRVWLSREEEQGYYYGFANEGLWPLCHIAHARPTFRSDDWAHYREVNRRFSDAVCEEAGSDDPIVLVQDYHFALAPRMIRERLPRATILTFWHIPWPNSERFGICPFHDAILDGMLGSSIVGFHTQLHCNNFLDAVDRFLEARIDRERQAVVAGGRQTLVRPYPISIEWPDQRLSGVPTVAECRAEVFRELRLRPDALLGVGVDRLDYTKGIEERLLAVERLLERFPALRGRFTFAQLAAPSRTAIERYRDLNDAVERLATRINGRFGSGDYRPIALLRAHHEPPTVFRFYRAADLCYVSSLHDGMNLVAKEFVAARDDERGALVLSRFTGAARELTESLLVNPYDLDQAAAALAAALAMSPEEQGERMRAMRSLLSHFNVYRWAGRMLIDAASLRRRDQLAERWSDVLGYRESAAS